MVSNDLMYLCNNPEIDDKSVYENVKVWFLELLLFES